jgi:hypothetical protein
MVGVNTIPAFARDLAQDPCRLQRFLYHGMALR